MISICRIGTRRVVRNGLPQRLCKVLSTSNVVQKAFITGKARRTDRLARPPPFDYVGKRYGIWAELTDPMLARFDDNSRLIVVEGPIAAGKAKFAQKLAEELEMIYFPPFTFDDLYIDYYNYDNRSMNPELPESGRFYDTESFLTNPKNPYVARIQVTYYYLRLEMYINAMLHILSTGQGVVLNRCIYSDFVFMDAMFKAGLCSTQLVDYHKDIQTETQQELCRPHLVVYLDTPVEEVQKRIRDRNIPYEVNSTVLTPSYLSNIERNYKYKYLPEISKHAHVLVYDWTKEEEIESVVHDIEDLDFDNYGLNDTKMRDWLFETKGLIVAKRRLLNDDRHQLITGCNLERYDVPELYIPMDDRDAVSVALQPFRGGYEAGFDPEKGDSVLFKEFNYKPYFRQSKRRRDEDSENLKTTA